MASNQDIRSNEIGVQRDSFDQRVCDDLCEDILQWLPFDDKIKLIDVSKQFNRSLKTLWIRQKVLKIGSNIENDRNDCLKFVTQMTPKMMNNSTKVFRFTKLLETFPNITSIVLKGCNPYINISQIFDLITEYCHKLESFRSDSYDFDSESMLDFGLKFGPNLKTLDIKIGDIFDFKRLINRSTSLKSLRIVGSTEVMIEFDDNSYYVLVNDLKKLSASFRCFNDFDKIIENNKSLTHLAIRLDLRKPLEICVAFEKISGLKELKYLRIVLVDNNLYDPQMSTSFELIVKNCIHLKTFYFEIAHRKHFPTKDFFNGFKGFSSLNKINLYSINYDDYNRNEYNLSIDCIQNCKQLTHLSLALDNIPKEFFSTIDSVFPYLKYLLIEMEDQLADNELKSMSRLKHLETLSISRSYNDLSLITDSGVLSLINGCNHLNNLSIYSSTSITERSIISIKQKAIENPGLYFKYHFYNNFNVLSIIKNSLNLDNIEIKV